MVMKIDRFKTHRHPIPTRAGTGNGQTTKFTTSQTLEELVGMEITRFKPHRHPIPTYRGARDEVRHAVRSP
jgi:hypothetical protein